MEVKHTHEMNEARKDITFGGVFRLNTGDVFLKHAKEWARCAPQWEMLESNQHICSTDELSRRKEDGNHSPSSTIIVPMFPLCPVIIPPAMLGIVRLVYNNGFEPPHFVVDNGRQNRKPGHDSRFPGNRKPPNHSLHLLIMFDMRTGICTQHGPTSARISGFRTACPLLPVSL